MSSLRELGRMLLWVAGMIGLVGLLLLLGDKLSFLGKLPGDIHIERPRFSFYFPLTTSLLVSLVLTAVINIVVRLLK